MKIHLLRSPEVSKELFFNVLSILNQFEGPLKFITEEHNNPFGKEEITDLPFRYGEFKISQDVEEITLESMPSNSSMKAWRPPFPDNIQKVSWKSIFEKCNDYRSLKNIPDKEAVILFTDFINENNWFSGGDPTDKLNFFVHSSQ